MSGYPDTKYNRIQLKHDGRLHDADAERQGLSGRFAAGHLRARPPDARDDPARLLHQRRCTRRTSLRQRVAWALSQIVVTSGNEPDLSFAHVMSRYQNIMFQEAFGNYENLLQQGHVQPGDGQLPRHGQQRPCRRATTPRAERELRSRDHAAVLGRPGRAEPRRHAAARRRQASRSRRTTRPTSRNSRKVFTGYTYANSPTPTDRRRQAERRVLRRADGPVSDDRDAGHDPNAKTLLNGHACCHVPAGQTGAAGHRRRRAQRVHASEHAGSYVGKQLIQRLVTGNPTPAYVARDRRPCSTNNGSGVRGDLKAVVKAILLDPEARGPAKPAPTSASLREPVLMVTACMRALNG